MQRTEESKDVRAVDDAMAQIRSVAGSARPKGRVVRCDGNQDELLRYARNREADGWRLAVRPRKGDLMLSTVGQGEMRLIVALTVVESVDAVGVAHYSDDDDAPILPGVLWSDVMAHAGLPSTAPWKMIDSAGKVPLVDSLCEVLRLGTPAHGSDTEGDAHRCTNRERSRANRRKKLAQAQGVCEACRRNMWKVFGEDLGNSGLDVHHVIPMAQRGNGSLVTSLDDLAVVCATCHRLIHADLAAGGDPKSCVRRLRARWLAGAVA